MSILEQLKSNLIQETSFSQNSNSEESIEIPTPEGKKIFIRIKILNLHIEKNSQNKKNPKISSKGFTEHTYKRLMSCEENKKKKIATMKIKVKNSKIIIKEVKRRTKRSNIKIEK